MDFSEFYPCLFCCLYFENTWLYNTYQVLTILITDRIHQRTGHQTVCYSINNSYTWQNPSTHWSSDSLLHLVPSITLLLHSWYTLVLTAKHTKLQRSSPTTEILKYYEKQKYMYKCLKTPYAVLEIQTPLNSAHSE